MSEKNESSVVEVTIGEGEEVIGLMKSSNANNKKSSKIISTDDTISGTWRDKYLEWKRQKYRLPRHYRLVSVQYLIMISIIFAFLSWNECCS